MLSNSKINKMKLNKKAFALSTGIILGLAVLVITFIFVIFNYEGRQLAKLGGLFCGYSVTCWGAFIGLAWGMIYGVIGGWLFAWLYNKLEK
jgi:drug/metabolite transporter superfamily protein YnfA